MTEILSVGDRVEARNTTGDRKRFEGRLGEVVRIQQRRKPDQDPFVHVWFDGARRSSVLWSNELAKIDG
jgi:hypothetical protein